MGRSRRVVGAPHLKNCAYKKKAELAKCFVWQAVSEMEAAKSAGQPGHASQDVDQTMFSVPTSSGTLFKCLA